MIRKELYSVDKILSEINFDNERKKQEIILDGDHIKLYSLRYLTFKYKGTTCAKCGLEGKFFAKEKHNDTNRYHLNLYTINNEGKEILMTKDHILAISKGGKNNLENLQTLCFVCNINKGNE
jgi:5-methylcytosine-specific restriction endonuclease McrA